MTTKHDVIRIHRAHPDWWSTKIAEALGCDSAYVRATAVRNGLVLAKCFSNGRPLVSDDEIVRRQVRLRELRAEIHRAKTALSLELAPQRREATRIDMQLRNLTRRRALTLGAA